MESRLRILHLEDDPNDAELVRAALETEGIIADVECVETQAEFVAALERDTADLIFADHTLPSFDGLSALRIARERRPDVPFIFVSGTLSEEVAIEALRNGATDYLLKDRLAKIVPSVQRALREARERAERKRAERLLAGENRLLEIVRPLERSVDLIHALEKRHVGLALLLGPLSLDRDARHVADLLDDAQLLCARTPRLVAIHREGGQDPAVGREYRRRPARPQAV